MHRTPVHTSSYFDQRLGARLFFKCENFQKIGAFKIRGATNAILSLSDEERRRGVVTHSSGNHAQALALASRQHGCRAIIVMPKNAPAVKRAAVEGYGAEVRLCEPTQAAREEMAAQAVAETGAVLIHSFNDLRIVAGQSTAAKELLEDVPDLDLLVSPVGGGGLASGTVLSARHFGAGTPAGRPGVKVLGTEPTGADDAQRSLEAGKIVRLERPQSIADGLLTTIGTITFPILRAGLEGIVTVDDDEIVAAMRLIWERMKLVVEPSAAVPVAALLKGEKKVRGLRVGVILSGGNVDLGRLPWND
jgi:threonine dehydratase